MSFRVCLVGILLICLTACQLVPPQPSPHDSQTPIVLTFSRSIPTSTPPETILTQVTLPPSTLPPLAAQPDNAYIEPTPLALPHIFKGHNREITGLAFSPDGSMIVTLSNENSVRVWDRRTGALLKTFYEPQLGSIAISPDGKTLLTSGYNFVNLWDIASGEKLKFFGHQRTVIRNAVFSPDGKSILAGGQEQDTRIHLWDIDSQDEIKTFEGVSAWYEVTFAPDGTAFLTNSGNGKTLLWELNSGKILKTYTGADASGYSVAFSPQGETILVGSYDFKPRLLDRETGQILQTFIGHTAYVSSVVFSPDGTQVLTGSQDETAILWDVKTGMALKKYRHDRPVTRVAFSPDGHTVLTGQTNGQVILWDTHERD